MFQRLVATLEAAWRLIEWLAYAAIVLLMACLVTVTSYQVFSRYVLRSPLGWSEELSRYVFVWIVFLAAWAAFKEGGHLAMDLVVGRLRPVLRRWIGKLIDGILLLFLLFVITTAPEILGITARQTSAVLNIPMSYVYLALPTAAVLMIGEILLGWLNPHRLSPGEEQVESGLLTSQQSGQEPEGSA